MDRDRTGLRPPAHHERPSRIGRSPRRNVPPHARGQGGRWLARVWAIAILLGATLGIDAAKAWAQPIGIEIPLARWQLASPDSSALVELNVLYEPGTSERIRQAMLVVPWTVDEGSGRPWLAKIAAGQVPADHRKLLAIQGLQVTNMADVATAYLIEAIDVVRGYRVVGVERIALQSQLARSLLGSAQWRSGGFRAKQEIAERLAYATLFIREMAQRAVEQADAELAEGLRARVHRQVREIFRIDLTQARIDPNEGLRVR